MSLNFFSICRAINKSNAFLCRAHQPNRYLTYSISRSCFVNTSLTTCSSKLLQGVHSSRSLQWPVTRSMSTSSAGAVEDTSPDLEAEKPEYHTIIKDNERGTGSSEKHEFQAETRKLLDIVAKSLYSGKEVFIRELISNSSDALEKLRYLEMTGSDVVGKGTALEIHIATDDNKKTFTIQDTGVGMTRSQMIDHLGTIAKSGSKSFMDEVSQQSSEMAASNIIGQFGVGFYSTFMVADKVEVFSKTSTSDEPAHRWVSDGSGEYEIAEADGVQRGTKIILQLKGDCYDFARDEIITDIIKKYSNFVGSPIYLNGKKVNTLEAIWMADPKNVTDDMHEEFYRYIAHAQDRPRFSLQYKADAPLNIRSLFYVPEHKPTLFDMSRETETGVALYSRKVMITPHAPILPKWLRFLKGVVDSEDVPLNLSREFMQDHQLIRKLTWVLTNRLLKFLNEKAKKEPAKYMQFYEDYGMFFREGIVTTHEQEMREEIAKLLRFESSKLPAGEVTSLSEYTTRMKAGDRNIYYLSAPNRELAESSPYFEAMAERNVEVLFAYEGYDELVLINLQQFDKKTLRSIESELQSSSGKDSSKIDPDNPDSLSPEEATKLTDWLQATLGLKIKECKVTNKLASHPCVITVAEMGAVRHFLRTNIADQKMEDKYRLLNATLEINPTHPIMKKLSALRTENSELASLLAEQLFDNAMVSAGLLDDPRSMVNRLNSLLAKVLEKH